MKRVVVTGIGIVSCLGNNQEEVYKSSIKFKIRYFIIVKNIKNII